MPVAALVATVVAGPGVVAHLTPELLLIGLGLAILLPVVPFAFELLALRRLTTAAFGTLMSLEPAIAMVIGFVVLHQDLGLVAVVGIGCRRRCRDRRRAIGCADRRLSVGRVRRTKPPGQATDGEAAGPGDLLAGGEGELQEAERLELAGAAEGAGVDGAQAAGGDDVGEQRLGVGVVAGDEHRGRRAADGARGEGAAKVVLNALSTRDWGSAAAISAAAEPSAGTTSESKVSKFSGLVMSTTTLPASCSPRLATTSATAG